jgi:L-ascorbate metabolism protein UlaG (beta-lactamase superfamily)
MVNIVSSSSKGNCVIYNKSIMVDCGVPFVKVKPYVDDIGIILLTHSHKDHINISTLKKIQLERPGVRIGCCEWMLPFIEGLKNVDVFSVNKLYDYITFRLVPIRLYHDVPNCGYRLLIRDTKIIHMTDTSHLRGIVAPRYDIYAIEANYDEDEVWKIIAEKEKNGLFAHERGAINSHLSEQQCGDFYLKNKGENSILVRLHE